MARRNEPIIVTSTGYALASDEEIEALSAKQRKLDAQFTEEQRPVYEAIARDQRDTSEFWDDLEWNSLPWWKKIW